MQVKAHVVVLLLSLATVPCCGTPSRLLLPYSATTRTNTAKQQYYNTARAAQTGVAQVKLGIKSSSDITSTKLCGVVCRVALDTLMLGAHIK